MQEIDRQTHTQKKRDVGGEGGEGCHVCLNSKGSSGARGATEYRTTMVYFMCNQPKRKHACRREY